ncbi:hypothetical protein, partial [Bacteroides caecimuris]|uniref:hypothetical protein n=1 Tax=Bacteroides caecimuris TaxID=1796613 RepID=UPI0026762625
TTPSFGHPSFPKEGKPCGRTYIELTSVKWAQPRCNHASMQSTITDGRKFSDRRPVLLTDANAIEESLSAF